MMKWLALSLLVVNLLYLAWELDRETRLLVANSPPPLQIPAAAGTLQIIDETAVLQELKPIGWQMLRQVLSPVEGRGNPD